MLTSRAIAVALVYSLSTLCTLPLCAQDDLRLVIVEGSGGTNNIRRGSATTRPVVEVRDRNDKPVAGAIVTFTLPQTGASGTFAGGGKVATLTTDALGRAGASFNPAGSGPLNIQVTAAHQGQTASATIAQTNVIAGGAGMTGTTIGIIAGIVAGGAIAAVCATGNCGGGSDPTPTPTPPASIRIGAGTTPIFVGAPPR